MRALVEVSGRLGTLVTDIAVMQTMVKGFSECVLEVVISEHLTGAIEDCAYIHRRHLYGTGYLSRHLAVNFAALSQEWDVFLQLHDNGALRWSHPWIRATIHRQLRNLVLTDDKVDVWSHRLSILHGVVPHYMDLLETHIPLLDGRCEHAMRVAGITQSERLLTVAPGAAFGGVPWPESKAVALVNELKANFDRVLVLGRAANGQLCRRVADATAATPVAGNLPLPYALALLSASNFHIGTDNCMAQVAAAYGTPTVCVGGKDNYLCPWRQRQVLGNPETITQKEIMVQVRELLA